LCVRKKNYLRNKIIQTLNITTMAYVISDDCVACGTCIDECPQGAISEGEKYSINPELCIDCGSCASVCPSEAIHEG
jgi:ferredoxin